MQLKVQKTEQGPVETLERFEQNRRVIEDFASKTLAAVPTDMGRLLHVSMLRDFSTGRYCHEGLEALYSESATNQALAYCHEELFARVLGTPLEQQEADLRGCLAAMDGDFGEIAARWLELGFYRLLVPFGSPDYLRDLFFSNLRMLLSLFIEERANLFRAA